MNELKAYPECLVLINLLTGLFPAKRAGLSTPPLPPPAEPTPKTETTDEETTGEQPDWSRGAGGQFHSCRTRQADLAFTLEVLAWPL